MSTGLISKKYLIDIANAIRAQLNSESTYTPAEMATAISNITGVSGASIVKSSNTDSGIITDTLLDDICNALRLKLDTQDTFTPSEIADAILTISSGLNVPSWSTGTDAEIAQALEDHYNGIIDLTDYWSVGDSRSVTLSATTNNNGTPAMSSQVVNFVLLNAGGKPLATPINGIEECVFIAGLVNKLSENGKMKNSSTSSSEGWADMSLRTWCNNSFRGAIPQTLRNCFKQFINHTAAASKKVTTTDYFSPPAEKEYYGSNSVSNGSYEEELSRFKYFENHGFAYSWLRSCRSSYLAFYVRTGYQGSRDYSSQSDSFGIVPFGCL